jgi:deoxyribonuclease-4
VATYAFLWERPLENTLKQIADWGFRYVELMTAPPHVWPRDMDLDGRRALRRLLAENGLEVVALCPTFLDLNIASPNPGILQESVRQIQETVRLAHDLEVHLLVLIPGRRHILVPQPFDGTWLIAKAAIEQCVEEAERYGVTIGLENAPSLFLERSEQLCSMVQEVGSDNLRVVLDVANTAVGESPTDALDTVQDYLVHVHISDRADASWAHLTVGQGLLDFDEIFAKLEQIGFKGASIIETTSMSDPDGGVLASKAKLEAIGWHA